MKKILFALLPILLLMLLTACDPLAYNPSPIAIVITNPATNTPPPTLTPTPTASHTPTPTATIQPSITPTPFPCDETEGQVIDFNQNPSEIAGENLRYRVYLPPCYFSTQRRFPLVILLHGLSYREQQWQELGLIDALNEKIRAGSLAPMLVVMPYLGTIGQLDQFPPDPSYERVILEELLPTIERDFCVWQSAAYRAIGGISKGGFWAYSIGLRHPQLFGSIGGHSAYFPNDTQAIPPPYNPLELALNSAAALESAQRLYMDNGGSDSSGPSQQLMSSRLTQRGIKHSYVVHPVGEHNNDYWAAHVGEYLDFYGKDWETTYNNLPSCAEPSPA